MDFIDLYLDAIEGDFVPAIEASKLAEKDPEAVAAFVYEQRVSILTGEIRYRLAAR